MNSERQARQSLEEEASAAFVQRMCGRWTVVDQAALHARLKSDPAYAHAYHCVHEAWKSLDAHAESPVVMRYREEAIAYGRSPYRRCLEARTFSRKGLQMAAAVVTALFLGISWQLSPYGYSPGWYGTGIGEQRVVELEDHSRIVLDAATRLRVRYTPDARIVELEDGQAQFSVAKDPTRPFKVEAGGRTIVAVGTVFVVEYIDSRVNVAMVEGKVAVLATAPSPVDDGAREGISLIAGEVLQVSRDGRSNVTPNADLQAATAWRTGKVVMRDELLADAVRRMNRYSRLKIEIDDSILAEQRINGVFEAGDPRGFVRAIQQYLDVVANYDDSRTVRLRLK